MNNVSIILFLFVFGLLGAFSKEGDDVPENDPDAVRDVLHAAVVFTEQEGFDARERSPLDLIKTLEASSVPQVTVWGTPRQWINRNHVQQLMLLADSQKECAAVRSPLSAGLGERSTVGHEARLLIAVYARQTGYPSTSNSQQSAYTLHEIRAWWDAGGVPLERNLARITYFRPQAFSPLDLLRVLEESDQSQVPALAAREDWIRREHVKELINLIDLEEPCSGVRSRLSAGTQDRSTVGHEAKVLLDAYVKRVAYPHFLNSDDVTVSADELREWWREEQAREEEAD